MMHVKNAIYISRNGKTLGRFSLEQLKSLCRNGILRDGDLGREDDQAEWQPLGVFMPFDDGDSMAVIATGERARKGQQPVNGRNSAQRTGRTVLDGTACAAEMEPRVLRGKREELATSAQQSFIREFCGWVPPGLTKAEAQTLIEQLQTEAMEEPLSDEQMRQMCFYGLEFSRTTTCKQAEQLIAEYVADHKDCEARYQEWRRACHGAIVGCL